MTEGVMHARLRALSAWAVAAVFFVAAGAKIIDPAGFVADLRNYRLLPWWSLNGVALVLPWWEFLAAVALLIPSWRRSGALLTLLMGILFIVSVSQALVRGLDISCGCFGHGTSGTKAGIQTLLIDVGIIIASLYVRAGPFREPESERSTGFPVVPAEAASHSAG